MKKHLVFKDNKSDKFWEIEVSGSSYTVRYGKTGAKGSCKTKEFDNEKKALIEAEHQVELKLKKGYKDAAALAQQKALLEKIDDPELARRLEECDGGGDFRKLLKEYYKQNNYTAIRSILEYVQDPEELSDVVGYSMQSLSQDDHVDEQGFKIFLEYETDEFQYEAALKNSLFRSQTSPIVRLLLDHKKELAEKTRILVVASLYGTNEMLGWICERAPKEILNEPHDVSSFDVLKKYIDGEFDTIYSLTPLLAAIRSGSTGKVETLLNSGADINYKNGTKKPLEYAQEYSTPEVADFLKARGAEDTADDELTIYEVLQKDKLHLVNNFIGTMSVEELSHSLDYAANTSHVAGVKALLKADFTQNQLTSALSSALSGNNGKGGRALEIVKMLIEKGAVVKKCRVFDDNLLEAAESRGYPEIVEYLQKGGKAEEIHNEEAEIEELTEKIYNTVLSEMEKNPGKTAGACFDPIPLSDYYDLLKDSQECEEQKIYPWTSCLGGHPYMLKDTGYPLLKSGDPMPFFGQINFAELPRGLFSDQPESGILQIYLDSVHAYESKYIFIKEVETDMNKLRNEFDFDPLLENYYKIEFSEQAEESLPYKGDIRFDEIFNAAAKPLLDKIDNQIQGRVEERVLDWLSEEGRNSGHQSGGYGFCTQDDPRYRTYKGYLLLLQMDELEGDGDGFFWGDSGIGHIYIAPDALKTLDFDKTYFHFDCY